MQLISRLANIFNRARSNYLAKKGLIRAEELPSNLRHTIGKPAGSKFMDLGCGVGSISILAAKNKFEVYAVDKDKSQLLYKRERKVNLGINLIIADGQRLPFHDRSFDVIYCCHVLEHVPNDSSALIEIHRVLKDDGVHFLSVPNISNLSTRFKRILNRKNLLVSPEHLREYNKDELITLLDRCGFNILGIKMTGFLLPLGNIFFNFVVLQFGLQKVKNYLADRFPKSSESIDIAAAKKGWREEELKLQQWEPVFPLPWWLKW